MWRPAHDLLPHPPYAESHKAAAAARRWFTFASQPPSLHKLVNRAGMLLRLKTFPVLVLVTDDMPENKGQNSRVLCSRVGAARHEQGRVGDGILGKKKHFLAVQQGNRDVTVIIGSTAGQ